MKEYCQLTKGISYAQLDKCLIEKDKIVIPKARRYI